jgi:hypothetical protein
VPIEGRFAASSVLAVVFLVIVIVADVRLHDAFSPQKKKVPVNIKDFKMPSPDDFKDMFKGMPQGLAPTAPERPECACAARRRLTG